MQGIVRCSIVGRPRRAIRLRNGQEVALRFVVRPMHAIFQKVFMMRVRILPSIALALALPTGNPASSTERPPVNTIGAWGLFDGRWPDIQRL